VSVVPVPEVSEKSDPERVLPTITLTQDELEFVHLQAEGRNGTGYLDEHAEHNTNYGEEGKSKFLHLKGVMGEAGTAKYYDGTVYRIDERLTRSGDDGIDLVFHRDVEYDDKNVENGKIISDVKNTNYGYSTGVCPLLKICRDKHSPAVNRIYILVEVVNHDTVRIIGYIHSQMIEAVAEEVDEGEVYKPDSPRKKFTSRDDNYVVDLEETTSFRAVWREWHPEEINV